jgi:phenylacetate-CoA ligase
MDWARLAYDRTPIAVQNLMAALYGWRLKRLRYGKDFADHYAFLERSQHFSGAALRDYQEHQLRELLTHCHLHVPHYRRLMEARGLAPESVSLENLGQHFPIVIKDDLRNSSRDFRSAAFRQSELAEINTSGTTGSPLNIVATRSAIQKNYAFFARFLRWAGVGVGQRSATFAGRIIIPSHQKGPPYWRRNPGLNNTLFSSYHISDNTVSAYLEELEKLNPRFIDSYPSAIFAIAQYVNRNAVLHTIRPKAIITSSETLFPHQRLEIEKAFQCPVFDQYGSAEMVAFIGQCEFGVYHANPEYGLLEVVDKDGMPVAEGSVGQLVCTGFLNFAMPLIRYRIGDSVILGSHTCNCGRNFPVVESVVGRTDDLIVTPDGRYVGRLDPIFKGLKHIKESQIIQERTDLITILLVREPGYTEDIGLELIEALKRRVGEVTITIKYCNSIPRTEAGKFRSVISRITSPTSVRA